MNEHLITGVAGFIAWKVAELLLDGGQRVIGVDNLNDGYDVRLKNWRLAQLRRREGFEFHRLDITDQPELRQLFQLRADRPFDAVINLAARAGVRQSLENPRVYLETNVVGTLNLLELCREFGVPKFVIASSSSLYGNVNSVPFREDANTDCPVSPYAASKKAAEALCFTYHTLYGIDVTVFRYFTVFGPAGRPDMSPFRFVQWISEDRPVIVYGDGRQSRDFTYVDDIARGTIAGIKQVGFEIVNLGCDAPIVLMDLIHLVERLIGKNARVDFKPWSSADVYATWADIGKANRVLGWRPQVPFDTGIANLVAWYRDNRDWARDVSTQ